MPQNIASEIGTLIEEYGRQHGVEVSGWTTSYHVHSCVVLGLPNADQARGLTNFLRERGMTAQVVPPSKVVTDWGVVALSI